MTLAVRVAVLLLLPSAAFAQGNPGPFGGLFGRTPERIGRDYTVFEIRTSTGLQLDDEMLAAGAPDGGIGAIAGLTGAAIFDHRTSRLQTRLRNSASYHQFLQTPAHGATTVESSGMLTWRFATRFSVDASATYLYSPYFQFFPSLATTPYVPGVIPPSVPYITGLVESDTVDATAGFTSFYSKNSTVGAWLSRRQTSYRHNAEADFEANGVRALWTRRTGRNMTVRLGYSREKSRSAAVDATPYLNEAIEAGVDFAKPLSLSRNTSLDFHTESTFIGHNGARHFRLNGGVILGHGLSRSWRLTVNANRNTEFLAEFSQPLFSDMAGVTVAGLLANRAELFLSANLGSGYFGVEGTHGRFRTATTTAQLSVALTRKFGLFAQYGIFHYEYPPGATTVATPYTLSRQSLTFGANAWLPIINRERTPSDSR